MLWPLPRQGLHAVVGDPVPRPTTQTRCYSTVINSSTLHTILRPGTHHMLAAQCLLPLHGIKLMTCSFKYLGLGGVLGQPGPGLQMSCEPAESFHKCSGQEPKGRHTHPTSSIGSKWSFLYDCCDLCDPPPQVSQQSLRLRVAQMGLDVVVVPCQSLFSNP